MIANLNRDHHGPARARPTSFASGWPSSARAARPARDKHTARGKLLVRDRVDRLLDPGSPFLELQPAGRVRDVRRTRSRQRRDRHRHRPGQRARVRGGRQRRDGQGRHLLPDDGQEAPAGAGGRRATNRLPCIYLVDSGGAFLPMQDEVFPDREHFGRIFFNQANLSAARIPQIAVGDGLVHGRRRLRAGDVRRDGDRPQPGHDLPRRPAAGEGGDRRGRHGRGARRRRRARPHLRRGRPPRRRRRARAGASCARSSARCERRTGPSLWPAHGGGAGRGPGTGCTTSCRPTPARRTTSAR